MRGATKALLSHSLFSRPLSCSPRTFLSGFQVHFGTSIHLELSWVFVIVFVSDPAISSLSSTLHLVRVSVKHDYEAALSPCIFMNWELTDRKSVV